jgi:cytoskeleton protein RodZ
MNPEETEEALEGRATGPGERLKRIREAQGLDLSRVAALLHLGEDKLEALEADQYDRLPGSVFTQGYLRNYARLLGVPTEPLLAAYHELHGPREPLPELHIAQVRHEVGSGHLLVRLITWGIVIGLIALVVIWWRGYLQWPSVTESWDDGSATVAETADALPGEPGSTMLPGETTTDGVPEMGAGGEGILRLPPQEEALPEDAAREETPTAAGGEETGVTGTAEMGEAALPAPAAEPEPEPKTEPEAMPEPAATTGRINLTFGQVSWVKIQDAGGSFKLQGEMKAGTRRVLGGTPPYQVVLGNANSVSISVDGKPFDLTPHIRGNVARFTLDPRSLSENRNRSEGNPF